jgi:hypothetical protein
MSLTRVVRKPSRAQDEWSMLAQRAQAVRVREAIKGRGLLLHDAFLKFDYDRNGLLTPGEVYGALEWLRVPDVTPADVLFFVRSVSTKGHLTYSDFIEVRTQHRPSAQHPPSAQQRAQHTRLRPRCCTIVTRAC